MGEYIGRVSASVETRRVATCSDARIASSGLLVANL